MSRWLKRLKNGALLFLSLFVAFISQSLLLSSVPVHATATQSSIAEVGLAAQKGCVQPPAHIDIFTLSDRELAKYGFPNHAWIIANPQAARQLLLDKRRSCSDATFGANMPRPHTYAVTSSNWSGYAAISSHGTFQQVAGYFTVPAAASRTTNADAAPWVGLGGTSSRNLPLVQTGVDTMVDRQGLQHSWAWYEIYPAPPFQLNLTVKPGDKIWAYVSSNANGGGYDGFLVEDLTTRMYATHYEHNPSTLADGTSAECILERAYPRFINFGTETFSSCGASNDGRYEYTLGSFSPTQFIIPGSANVSNLTNGSNFDVTWQHA